MTLKSTQQAARSLSSPMGIEAEALQQPDIAERIGRHLTPIDANSESLIGNLKALVPLASSSKALRAALQQQVRTAKNLHDLLLDCAQPLKNQNKESIDALFKRINALPIEQRMSVIDQFEQGDRLDQLSTRERLKVWEVNRSVLMNISHMHRWIDEDNPHGNDLKKALANILAKDIDRPFNWPLVC